VSEYAGRIAIGAIVAVAFAVGLGFELMTYAPGGNTSTGTLATSSALNASSWFGTESPPAGCGNATTRGGFVGWGYRDDVQSSWPLERGSNACIYTYLQNTGNQSTSLPTNESLVVTNIRTPGVVYFQSECVAPPYSGSFGANSSGWNCVVFWNTANAYNVTGLVEYQVAVRVQFSNSPLVIRSGDNLYVGEENTGTTASSHPGPSCGGPIFKLLTPAQNGSIYLKVVTDQGFVITNNGPVDNGTVFVTHTGPAASGGKADYCLRLGGNGTGYMELAANDGLPQTGSYNLTLFAGYSEGPGFQGTIPPSTVQPDTIVYVTVSVPSGEVTTMTCARGGDCTNTTTTATNSVTATTSSASGSNSTGSSQLSLPGCNVLVGTVSKEGFQLQVYVESNTTKVGGNILICTDFQNLSNYTATTYAANNAIIITNSSGSVVAQLGCGGANVLQVPPGFECATNWITGIAGTTKLAPGIAAGTYTVNVVVPLAPSSEEGYSTIEFTTTLTLTN
jgi:hypothetical protein